MKNHSSHLEGLQCSENKNSSWLSNVGPKTKAAMVAIPVMLFAACGPKDVPQPTPPNPGGQEKREAFSRDSTSFGLSSPQLSDRSKSKSDTVRYNIAKSFEITGEKSSKTGAERNRIVTAKRTDTLAQYFSPYQGAGLSFSLNPYINTSKKTLGAAFATVKHGNHEIKNVKIASIALVNKSGQKTPLNPNDFTLNQVGNNVTLIEKTNYSGSLEGMNLQLRLSYELGNEKRMTTEVRSHTP